MNLRRLLHNLSRERVLGGTAVLAVTQFTASAAGLLRDRALFNAFPDLSVTDVYFASFRLSDFLFQACIVSALGTVLVPLLARVKSRPDEHGSLLSATMGMGATVFGALALVLAIGFPWLAPHLTQFEGEQLALYVDFGRLALLSNFLFVFGSTFGQSLIASQRFWIYGITPVLYTLSTVAGTMFLTPHYGPLGPMLGTICGAFLYAVLRAVAVWRSGVPLGWKLWHPCFPHMGMLMLPRMLSLGALQLQLLVFDAVGSGLSQGSISVNLASRNFQSVAVGVVGIALAQAVFAPLSEAAADGEKGRYLRYIKRSIGFGLLFTVPAAILLVASTPIAARLVHIEEFLSVFRWTLLIYALSIPLESLNHILLRGHYALQQTFLPAMSTVIAGVGAMLAAVTLGRSLGVNGIAIAFTTGQAIQLFALATLLPKALGTMKPLEPVAVVVPDDEESKAKE